jgi:hypothetical protein
MFGHIRAAIAQEAKQRTRPLDVREDRLHRQLLAPRDLLDFQMKLLLPQRREPELSLEHLRLQFAAAPVEFQIGRSLDPPGFGAR